MVFLQTASSARLERLRRKNPRNVMRDTAEKRKNLRSNRFNVTPSICTKRPKKRLLLKRLMHTKCLLQRHLFVETSVSHKSADN